MKQSKEAMSSPHHRFAVPRPQGGGQKHRMEKWAAYFSPATSDEELEEIAAGEEAIREAMEVEDVFTKDEVARRSYEKAEKFRRDQAAQLSYARQEGKEEGILGTIAVLLGTIAVLKSLNLDKKAIAIKLAEAFGLDDKAAAKYVEANW